MRKAIISIAALAAGFCGMAAIDAVTGGVEAAAVVVIAGVVVIACLRRQRVD